MVAEDNQRDRELPERWRPSRRIGSGFMLFGLVMTVVAIVEGDLLLATALLALAGVGWLLLQWSKRG